MDPNLTSSMRKVNLEQHLLFYMRRKSTEPNLTFLFRSVSFYPNMTISEVFGLNDIRKISGRVKPHIGELFSYDIYL